MQNSYCDHRNFDRKSLENSCTACMHDNFSGVCHLHTLRPVKYLIQDIFKKTRQKYHAVFVSKRQAKRTEIPALNFIVCVSSNHVHVEAPLAMQSRLPSSVVYILPCIYFFS